MRCARIHVSTSGKMSDYFCHLSNTYRFSRNSFFPKCTLYTQVKINKNNSRKLVNIFLPISFTDVLGAKKNRTFEYPQLMFG